MIGKIVTGKSFRGAVEYVLYKDKARLLDSDGVDISSVRSIIDDLNFQRKTRPEIAKVVAHISLSFHKDDAPRLTDELMRELAAVYMERMGITDTQFIIARHDDTGQPHFHIIYNRVRYDKKLVSDSNERYRNAEICKEIKQQYGLTFSEGKVAVKVERLHGRDSAKYAIYNAIKDLLPGCMNIDQLADELRQAGIETTFIHRGADTQKEIQGVTFSKDGQMFKGSQIDRKFSYAGLAKIIRKQAEKYAEHNPVVFGIHLTDEQVAEIKDGQPIYLRGMQSEGYTFDGYLVMDDNLRYGRAFIDRDPREWVQYGQYEMRRMDKALIEAGFVTHAVVKWWGGMGQTARPYLWKQNPADTEYRESWDDPRKQETPEQQKSPQVTQPENIQLHRKKGRGI